MPERRNGIVAWAARWGFAVLVGCGGVAAVFVGSAADPPAEISSFALQAAPVYRLEVAAAVFAGAYLAAMALVLALNNRAFSEIGTRGVKAHAISGEMHAEVIRRQQRELAGLARAVAELQRKAERETGKAATIPADDN